MKWLLALFLVFALSGCATPPPPLGTPTGRPEVTVQGVTKKQVIDTIVSRSVIRGNQIKSVNEYGVVLGRRVDGVGAAMLYGSRYDSKPEARVHINVIDDAPGAVRVFARAEMITNPGSAYERVNDVTDGFGNELMTSLRDIAAQLAQPVAPR